MPPNPDRDTSDSARHTRPGARLQTPATVLLVLVVCLGLTALLQAGEITSLGERMPPGPLRSVTLALAKPLNSAAAFLGLNRPAAAVGGLRTSSAGNPATSLPSTSATGAMSPSATSVGAPPTTTFSSTTAYPSTTTITEPPPVYSSSNPLRVWVGGDSMVEQVGDSLMNMSSALTYLDVRMTFKINSGLCRPDYFNWPALMEETVADFQPHVAVLMFGGNDMQGIVEDGEALAAFTPAWNEAYGRRVAAAIDTFIPRGTRMVWLGAPIMRDARDDAWSRDLDAIYAEVCNRYPESVDYIDCRSLFAGPDGGYAAYLQDGQGKTWHVREPDGIHFTLAGGDWVASEILRIIRGPRSEPS